MCETWFITLGHIRIQDILEYGAEEYIWGFTEIPESDEKLLYMEIYKNPTAISAKVIYIKTMTIK
jgi:hypothetical protein